MKIAVRFGHQYTGADGCASSIVNECDVNRRYGALLISKLQSLGHEVLNVTPPEDYRSLSNSLSYGISMANDWGADLFVSCHVNNCYDYVVNEPIGCEVVYGSETGRIYATQISNALAELGFENRGAKQDVRGLAEIRKTNMPCVIVEPFFCESSVDVNTYNNVGDEGISNAIVKGLTGQTVSINNEEVYDMKKLVVYYGDADVFGAIMVAQKNQCPLMKKSDFDNSGIKVEEVIQIGGKVGSDRFSTFKDSANLV